MELLNSEKGQDIISFLLKYFVSQFPTLSNNKDFHLKCMLNTFLFKLLQKRLTYITNEYKTFFKSLAEIWIYP